MPIELPGREYVSKSDFLSKSVEMGKTRCITIFQKPTVLVSSTSDFSGGSDGKESACNSGEQGSVPGSGRYSGEGNG